MIFSECIELARQKIAAQAHEYEDTPSDLVVRRWKYDDDFGDRFVYDGQSLPDSDPVRSDDDSESDESDSDLEYRCHYRVGCGTCIWKDSPLFAGLERQLVGRVVVGGAPMPGWRDDRRPRRGVEHQ